MESFVARMLQRKERRDRKIPFDDDPDKEVPETRYRHPPDQVNRGLSWLAVRLSMRMQTACSLRRLSGFLDLRPPVEESRLTSWIMRLSRAVVLALSGWLTLGAITASAQSNGAAKVTVGYRIGPEDTLLISVWRNDAMSKTVPVRPDGMISLPLLNDVKAAGFTPAELRDILVVRLAEYMPTPEVSVIVTEIRSFKVSVLGEVAKPARYELKSATTVLDVLALAGGLTEFAARSRIVIMRQDGNTVKRIPFNYNKVVAASGEHDNLQLQPGDIILVP